MRQFLASYTEYLLTYPPPFHTSTPPHLHTSTLPPTYPPQIRLEFDFMREARVMDAVSLSLAPVVSDRIRIPRSVPGLVTRYGLSVDLWLGRTLCVMNTKTQKVTRTAYILYPPLTYVPPLD